MPSRRPKGWAEESGHRNPKTASEVAELLCREAAGAAAVKAELASLTELTTGSVAAFTEYQLGREAQMRYLSHEGASLKASVASPVFPTWCSARPRWK